MNCRTVRMRDSLLLVSYNSVVAKVNLSDYNVTLYKDWDYGRTTVGHVTRFINNYTPLGVYGKKGIMSALKEGKITMGGYLDE